MEKGQIAQKIGLKKPTLKIPYFCKADHAFAYYTEKTNTVVVNYKQMEKYKYGLISKSKSKISVNPYCDKEYLAELKKSGSIDKFNVINLNEKEQMLVFKSVLSHELRHAFQFQAMINSSQVGKTAYFQQLKTHWKELLQKEGKSTQNVDETFDKIIRRDYPFPDKNEFKSVDIPEIFNDGKNSLTPQAIADNFIKYKESDGNVEIWANHLIERDAQCFSIRKTFEKKDAPEGVNKDWYKAVRAIEEYRYKNIFK